MPDKPQSTAEEILASLNIAALSDLPYEVFHNQILVAIHIKPERTEGGLYLPDKTRDEDRYQGKVGLVLGVGPAAFVNDARNDFHDQSVKPGDWVIFRVSDGTSLDINQVHCRQLEDIHIRGRVPSPKMIY